MFQEKQEKQEKQETFPRFGSLIEGKIFGGLRIPILVKKKENMEMEEIAWKRNIYGTLGSKSFGKNGPCVFISYLRFFFVCRSKLDRVQRLLYFWFFFLFSPSRIWPSPFHSFLFLHRPKDGEEDLGHRACLYYTKFILQLSRTRSWWPLGLHPARFSIRMWFSVGG